MAESSHLPETLNPEPKLLYILNRSFGGARALNSPKKGSGAVSELTAPGNLRAMWRFGFRVSGFGVVRVLGLRFRVPGLGFRV